MSKRTLLYIFGAALLVSAAPIVSGAGHPGAAQTSSTSTKKKKASSKSKKKGKVKGQAVAHSRSHQGNSDRPAKRRILAKPTGKWDAATMDAMKKYQDKKGLNPTGKIDAVTLNKLGLGSGTAGKGAPVPAASTSASPADPPSK